MEEDISVLKTLDESNNYFGNLGYNKKYSIKTIKYTNALLDRIDNDNHNYCYVEKDDIDVLKTCSEIKMYTIKPYILSENYPYKELKETLAPGIIISLSNNNTTTSNLNLMINYIKQKGYEIVLLDELLQE